MLGFTTLRHAITALRDQGQTVAAVLARQVEVEAQRVQLERERFAFEVAKHEAAEAERKAWKAEATGTDLPEVVTQTITQFAGSDAAMRAQLVKWARQRLEANVTPTTVAAELRTGIPSRTL